MNNPVQLLIEDRVGYQFETMNVILIESLIKFLREMVNGELVKVEEKLLKFKAIAQGPKGIRPHGPVPFFCLLEAAPARRGW